MGARIDHEHVVPVYMQVAHVIIGRIESGEYPPGSRLPSAVRLAREFSIAKNTAHKALVQVVNQSLAVVGPGKGTFVRQQTKEVP